MCEHKPQGNLLAAAAGAAAGKKIAAVAVAAGAVAAGINERIREWEQIKVRKKNRLVKDKTAHLLLLWLKGRSRAKRTSGFELRLLWLLR